MIPSNIMQSVGLGPRQKYNFTYELEKKTNYGTT